MRNVLILSVLCLGLNGCLLSGPMALLPPTAKYLMWSDPKVSETSAPPQSLTVQEMLQQMRSHASEGTDRLLEVHLPYQLAALSDTHVKSFQSYQNTHVEMICGPSDLASPIEAARAALKACGALHRMVQKRGLKAMVRFDPHAPKDQATVRELRFQGEDNA